MRDESMVIAGRLTGKWKFKCFVCGTEHKQENTIGDCANDFMGRLIRQRIMLGTDRMFQSGNPYEAAKKGLLGDLRLIEMEGDRVKKETFKLDFDRFSRAESEEEAAEVVLGCLEEFVRRKSGEFRSVFRKTVQLRERLEKAPVTVLGDRAKLDVQQYETVFMIDGEQIDPQHVKLYYERLLPACEAREKLHGGYPKLVWIDADKDRVVLSTYGAMLAIRPGQGGLIGRVFPADTALVTTIEETLEKQAIKWTEE